MTYAQYGSVQASDYNTLIGNSVSNTANTLNTVYSNGGIVNGTAAALTPVFNAKAWWRFPHTQGQFDQFLTAPAGSIATVLYGGSGSDYANYFTNFNTVISSNISAANTAGVKIVGAIYMWNCPNYDGNLGLPALADWYTAIDAWFSACSGLHGIHIGCYWISGKTVPGGLSFDQYMAAIYDYIKTKNSNAVNPLWCGGTDAGFTSTVQQAILTKYDALVACEVYTNDSSGLNWYVSLPWLYSYPRSKFIASISETITYDEVPIFGQLFLNQNAGYIYLAAAEIANDSTTADPAYLSRLLGGLANGYYYQAGPAVANSKWVWRFPWSQVQWSQVLASPKGSVAFPIYAANNNANSYTSFSSLISNNLPIAQAAGIKVIGHVGAAFAANTANLTSIQTYIQSSIDSWYSACPNIDGIFMGSVGNGVMDNATFWTTQYNYVKSKNSNAYVMIHPDSTPVTGWSTSNLQTITTVYDCVMMYEQSYNTTGVPTFPSWTTNYASSKFGAAIIEVDYANTPNVINSFSSSNIGIIYLSSPGIDTSANQNQVEVPAYLDKYYSYLDYTVGTANQGTGYGQTALANAVSATTVTSSQWANLVNAVANVANHQGSSITSVTAPTTNSAITYKSAIPTNIQTIYTNRFNTASVGTTTSNANTYGSTWQNAITFTHTATFANANAARYFFNAGGTLKISCSHPSGTNMDLLYNNLASNVGNVAMSGATANTITIASNTYSGITRVGGGGAPPQVFKNMGFYALTTANAILFTQVATTGPSGYLGSQIGIVSKVNSNSAPTVVTFYTTWDTIPNNASNPASSGSVTTLTVQYPESSNIANTWGTVTLTGTSTGS